MKLKTRTETPRRTGMTVRLRWTAYRLTASSSPGRAALLDLHRVEVLRSGRVGHVPLRRVGGGGGGLVGGDEEPPHVVVQHLLGLPIEPRPLRQNGQLLGAQEEIGKRRVRIEALARGARLTEEIAQEVVGIAVVAGPPEHVERKLAVLPFVQVHGPLGRLELCRDAGLREVSRHRLGDLLRVREVRPRARHVPEDQRLLLPVLARDLREPLREAGLPEKLPRSGRAVLEIFQLPVVAPERRGLELRRDEAGTAIERVHNGLLVDGVREGLADPLVLELLDLVVERDVAGGVRRTQEELKARVALDDRDVVRVEAFHAVDLARFQGAEPLGVVFDVPHDDALHPWLDTPVARVRLEDDLLVRLPLDELEGARADRVLPELQAPFFYRLRAGDVEDEHREVGEERSLRVLESDSDGVGADGLHLRDDRLVIEATELRLPVLERLAGLDLVLVLCVIGLPPPLEVPDDGGGVERRTVVELHVVSELEGPHPAVPRHLPFLGQGGLDP